VKGLSIGHKVPSGCSVYEKDMRLLRKIDVLEVSLVAVPMNPQAQIANVKSAIATVKHFESALRTLGYSKSGCAHCFDTIVGLLA